VSAKSPGGNGHDGVEASDMDPRRYLLGRMSADEEARFERAYLGSDEALEALRAHEDELIEDYLGGALDPADRERFERHFLASPPRIERLVFLRALMDRATLPETAERAAKAPARRPGSRVPAPLAALLAVAAVAGVLLLRSRPAAPPEPEPRTAAAPASIPGRTARLELRQLAVRGSDEAPVLALGGASFVELAVRIGPGSPFPEHRARLVAPDGGDAFVSAWQAVAAGDGLRVLLPASVLREGAQALVVEGRGPSGTEPLESYTFRVRP
jgi:hypothetical protein